MCTCVMLTEKQRVQNDITVVSHHGVKCEQVARLTAGISPTDN